MAAQRVALVTASSGGLGAAIARSMCPDHRVVINYFSSKERAEALVQELSSVPCTSSSPQQPRFLVVGGDVGNEPDLQHMVDETIRVMGRLDYVFSNGGWTEMLGFKSLDDNLDETVWDKCFDYNVKSHLRLMKIARPHLERTEGAFVTTASTAGVTASGSSLAYSVSKAGQIHLVKGLAKLCGPKIRVNSISPGLIMTDWGQRFDEDFKTNYKNRTLLKKIAEVEDVADQARVLATSRSITGQNVVIDAGATFSG